MDTPKDDFERGNTDVFGYRSNRYLEDLLNVYLVLEGNDDWKIQSIQIFCEYNGKTINFKINDGHGYWLGDDEGSKVKEAVFSRY